MSENSGATVVVGVDGSDCSRAAVHWAEAYAKATGGTLNLVTAWEWPAMYGGPLSFDGEGPEQEWQRVAEKAAAEVSLPAERVKVTVVQGSPRQELTSACEGAAVLVVGSRGHSTVGGLLLGSVSNYCVHHARVPVVVVPAARQ